MNKGNLKHAYKIKNKTLHIH